MNDQLPEQEPQANGFTTFEKIAAGTGMAIGCIALATAAALETSPLLFVAAVASAGASASIAEHAWHNRQR